MHDLTEDLVDAKRAVGVLLVVVGLISLIWGGISWTREETVLEIGGFEARAQQRERIPLPPVLGALALAGGSFFWCRERAGGCDVGLPIRMRQNPSRRQATRRGKIDARVNKLLRSTPIQ